MSLHGFSQQNGSIFGFDKNADEKSNVFKITSATSEELVKLDEFDNVNNIDEERNVDRFNYACNVSVRSKNLQSPSKKVVVKSSTDVFDRVSPAAFLKYRAQSNEIESIKVTWREKMRKLHEEGYKEKDLLHSKNEEKRLKDLQLLKNQAIPRAFTCKEDAVNLWSRAKKAKNKLIECILR